MTATNNNYGYLCLVHSSEQNYQQLLKKRREKKGEVKLKQAAAQTSGGRQGARLARCYVRGRFSSYVFACVVF